MLSPHPRRCAAALALSALAALAGCQPSMPTDVCTDAEISRLYMGRDTPHGEVSDLQWQAFVADTLAPRFPDGFTVLEARGEWREGRGGQARNRQEASHVVEIVHPDSPLERQRIRAVAVEYGKRFAQQSVLVAHTPSLQCLHGAGAA